MGVKEYELPNGRKAVFEFDENGVGKITLESMDYLMGLINTDSVNRSKMEKKYVCPIGHTDNCPLIEIDLERDIPTIWYNRQTGQYEPKGTKQEVYERLYKLKYGERRSE